MYSISQNLKNVLKNRIKMLINPILYQSVDFLIDNLFLNDNNINYFTLISESQIAARDIVRNVILSTFQEVDNDFKNCKYRKDRYYINKSNVDRTLITIVGELHFSRTYYQSKLSKENKIFYIDKKFNLPKYDHYDPIIKGISIDNATKTSQAQSAYDTSADINNIKFFMDKSIVNNISRQSVHNWIKKWNTPNIVPKSVETPETLYVMADEKYIGAQDIEKDIMVKCFVTFEDVKEVSKNRRILINRTVFSHYGSKTWEAFMDFIAKKYDFSKIKNIALLSDGGSWIKSGISELRLEPNNSVKFYLCEFHFKQAIHHITTDEQERKELLNIFNTKSKKEFQTYVGQIVEKNKNREEIINKKLKYILNNYSAIKSMLNLNIGSSMESHISHLIASFFSSRPKGYSTKRIEQYLKLVDYKNNGINIFKLYMQSYNYKDTITINEDEVENYTFDNFNNGNVPILNDGHMSTTYQALYSITH